MAEDIMDADALDHTSEVLDEVLQHTSALALRISHIDESLGEVRGAVNELRVVMLNSTSTPAAAAAPAPQSTHQLDHLEHESKVLKGRIALLTAFAALQTLALAALLLFALKPMPLLEAPAPVAEAPKPVAAPPAAPPEVSNSENLLKPAAPEEKPKDPPAKTAPPVKKKKK